MNPMTAQIRQVIIRITERLLEALVAKRPRHTWKPLFSELPCLSWQRGPLPTTEVRYDRESPLDPFSP